MYFRTHLVVGIFAFLLLVGFVQEKVLFCFVVLISSLIPDVDSRNSRTGKYKIFRPLQFFAGHRGMIHSFSFLIFVCFLLFLWKEIIAFGFFVGFGLHLIFDSFTKSGIYPFWPLKRRWHWKIKTGGRIETFLFSLFLVADILLFFYKFFGVL